MKGWKGKERKGKERKGKERKGKERKGKEGIARAEWMVGWLDGWMDCWLDGMDGIGIRYLDLDLDPQTSDEHQRRT